MMYYTNQLKSLNRVQLFKSPWTIQSKEFCRPEYWSGQPFPSPGHLPKPGIEHRSPTLQVDSLPAEPQGKPKNTGVGSLSVLQWIFPTRESNSGLLHRRRILYQLSCKFRHPNSFPNVSSHLQTLMSFFLSQDSQLDANSLPTSEVSSLN